MSTETLPAVNGPQLPAKETSPAAQFLKVCEGMAIRTLKQMLGDDEGKKRGAVFALAFQAAASGAKDGGKALYGCAPDSVAMALVNSIITGIMPGGPAAGCYILPKDGRCQWWINHRGMIQLARQSGVRVSVRRCYEGDVVDIWEGTNGLEIRLPVPRRDVPESYEDLLEVVVVVRDDSGRLIGVERVSKHQIEARRRKSMMANAGPWKDWPLEMADKTAIKYAVNRGIIIINDRDAREVMARDEEDSNVVLEAPAAPPKQLAGPDPLEVLDAPARREAVPVDAEEAPAK